MSPARNSWRAHLRHREPVPPSTAVQLSDSDTDSARDVRPEALVAFRSPFSAGALAAHRKSVVHDGYATPSWKDLVLIESHEQSLGDHRSGEAMQRGIPMVGS